MKLAEKIYCSLDIETSGFDPHTNEILEVGFAFFKMDEKGIKVTEEWTQVFKPSKPVTPQILGLTGISQSELDSAPLFSEHRDFIQEKLGEAVIVGHNVVFDIKFLESFGIKFNGQVIDTLDLVQFILPTHHSYNLENLMHVFGIEHKEAHRALADSKAALKLLEKLFQVYSGFPTTLKKKIAKLISDYNFSWQNLLKIELKPLVFSELSSRKPAVKKVSKKKALVLKAQTVYNFPLSENYLESLLENQNIMLVVPKVTTALELYKKNLAEGVFLPEFQFDEEKFNEFIKKDILSQDEIKFALKVLVWQHTNWQTKTFLDMNLSFFGGQFKSLISGGKIVESKTAKNLVCDMATFLDLSEEGFFKKRHVVISGLNEFETAITFNIGAKTSWGYINYILKSYYNPELSIGNLEFKDTVTEAFAASDLFFGLVGAVFQTDPPSFAYIKINEQSQTDEKYLRVKSAAENYAARLEAANKVLKDPKITEFKENLENFFKPEENRVKWIELGLKACSFLSMPLDISKVVEGALSPFSNLSFVDCLDKEILPQFFLQRLGLKGFTVIETGKVKKQGDLFATVKKLIGKPEKAAFHCVEKVANAKDIMELLNSTQALPAAVLFQSPMLARDFYEQNYQELKQKASLLAQSASGGSNKIFRNFSIHKNGLLIATDKFILKALSGPNAVEPVSKLPVKTLILCRLPFDQFTHPYQEALSASLPNAFSDYSLPRALRNFHSIIEFFYTPELKDIYVIDSKLAKPYAQVFKKYGELL